MQPAVVTHRNLRIVGFSLAGEETWIVLPELNVGFDVGRAPREVVGTDHIFLTHGHMDHAAGVAYYFAQRWFVDNQPGNLYVSEALRDPIARLLRVWSEIDGLEAPANLHTIKPGVDVVLRRDLIVRPFEVNHSTARSRTRGGAGAFGFAAIEVRQKLKDEFQGLTGPQLVDAKRRGEEITRRVELPLVTFCGDTGPGAFFDLDYVKDAMVLLLECTFLDRDHVDRARAGGHIHLSDLRAIVPRLNNERILLTHLSRRTSLADAKALLRQELGDEAMERVSFLMEHRPRRTRGPMPADAPRRS